MATFRPDLSAGFPPAAKPASLGGPLMAIDDWARLAQAPRRPPGTEVTMRAKEVFPWIPHIPLPGGYEIRSPDHMFLQFDDGHNPLIARGEPTKGGLDFVSGWLDGSNQVGAQVDPLQRSPDQGAGYRTLASRFLPGVTAEQAASAARQHADGVNRGGNLYNSASNSNSYAADAGEPIFGYRPGDDRTWGYQTHLQEGGAAPPSPLDLLSRQFPDRASFVPYEPF